MTAEMRRHRPSNCRHTRVRFAPNAASRSVRPEGAGRTPIDPSCRQKSQECSARSRNAELSLVLGQGVFEAIEVRAVEASGNGAAVL
jgi:hypothetical protein